jgi:hypothetical protein
MLRGEPYDPAAVHSMIEAERIIHQTNVLVAHIEAAAKE